jgi:hypothetical protein
VPSEVSQYFSAGCQTLAITHHGPVVSLFVSNVDDYSGGMTFLSAFRCRHSMLIYIQVIDVGWV